MPPHPRVALAALFLAVLGSAAALPAAAQILPPVVDDELDMRTYTGTGLGISASIPSVMSGLSVFRYMGDLGFGVFVTGRMNPSSPADDEHFEEGTTVPVAFGRGDERFRSKENYRMFTAGLIRAIDTAIAVYVGAGYTRKRAFLEFWDEEEERGHRGFYWVEDHQHAQSGINVTGGAMIQLAPYLFLQGGGELFPRGATLSVYFALPY